MWITLRGVSTILFTSCINTAVEEYVLKGNKQQLTMVCIRTYCTSIIIIEWPPSFSKYCLQHDTIINEMNKLPIIIIIIIIIISCLNLAH